MKKFQAKQAVLVELFKVKGLYNSSTNFYLQFYIQPNKAVFLNTISSHTEIIHEKWVHEWKASCIWTDDFERLQDAEFLSIKDLQ